MQNTPSLQTQRLHLRRFNRDDAEAYFLIGSDKEANKFLPYLPFGTMEEAQAHLEEKYLKGYEAPQGFHYAICQKADNIPIGYVNVADNDSFDFGYALRTEFWHKGIVTEACEAVVKLLRERGIAYITATHDINNPRSGNVMKKLGMTYCYSYKEQWQPKNIPVTFRMYQLNLNGQQNPIFQKYWDMYPEHFVEQDV